MKLLDILKSVHLIRADEIYEDTEDGYYLSIFWHSPSINLDWYPIIDVQDEYGNTIYNSEGPENEEYWDTWLNKEVVDKVEKRITKVYEDLNMEDKKYFEIYSFDGENGMGEDDSFPIDVIEAESKEEAIEKAKETIGKNSHITFTAKEISEEEYEDYYNDVSDMGNYSDMTDTNDEDESSNNKLNETLMDAVFDRADGVEYNPEKFYQYVNGWYDDVAHQMDEGEDSDVAEAIINDIKRSIRGDGGNPDNSEANQLYDFIRNSTWITNDITAPRPPYLDEIDNLDESWKDEAGDIPAYAVINSNGTYAGRFCVSIDEARELANQDDGRKIFKLIEVEGDFMESCEKKKKIKESIGNLRRVKNIAVAAENPVMADAVSYSEEQDELAEKVVKPFKVDKANKVVGAEKQPVPKYPETAKLNLDESLFD